MTKPPRVFLLAASCGLLVAFVIVFVRSREPSYFGRGLSEWVVLLGEGKDPQAPEAIRRIGARAVPYLVRWIEYETPAWRQKLYSFSRIRWLATAEEENYSRGTAAAMAFEFVGTEGKQALPTLLGLFNKPRAQCSYRAAYALAFLGTNGLPPLVAGLTNQDPDLRWACAQAISHTGSSAYPAVPALIECLSYTNKYVRAVAARALGTLKIEPALVVPALTDALQGPDLIVQLEAAEALIRFGNRAVAAVPILQQLLRSEDCRLRNAATNALRAIAPEPLTNAPPK